MIATLKQPTGSRAMITDWVVRLSLLTLMSFWVVNGVADAQTNKRLIRDPSSSRTVWSPRVIDADASAIPNQVVPNQVVPRRKPGTRASLVRVTPRAISSPPTQERSRSASRVEIRSDSGSQIRQVGFLEDRGRCGSVCDCGHCGSGLVVDPVCGIEGAYPMEVACGVEAGYGMEPVCGIEAGYGMEPVCGVEAYGISSELCGCDACSGPGVCGPEGCGVAGCDSYPCATPYHIDCFPLFLPILRIDWSRFEFFYGTQAYHNPMNDPTTGVGTRTDSGSFGFHQGFNEGRNLRPWLGADLSAQFGLRATQSNLHDEDFTSKNRNQIFITGGLFRRVDYGLQYGVVLDYLNEDWYYQTDLLQLRGELSWKMSACHNFGFHWMAGVNDESVPTDLTNEAGARFNGRETLEASNQYRAFYRYLFASTGEITSFIGGTDDDHFILGTHLEIPLKHCFSLQVGSTYFSPDDETTRDRDISEGWNLSMSFVYRPGQHHPATRYRRPMFNVADNGSFFVFR